MKENLVLVHSFPTNSFILKGLIEFFQDYFTVYFIDLPGFSSNSPSIKNINISQFSNFISSKILEFNLESYIIGGISFGFLAVNGAELDPKKCKAILAIEPYLNNKYLNVTPATLTGNILLLDLLFFSGLCNIFWGNKLGSKLLSIKFQTSAEKFDMIFQQMDRKTFFAVARLVLNYHQEPKLLKMPYILWINLNDKTIKSQKVIEYFQKNAQQLLIQNNNIEHYPDNISKQYFQSKIDPRLISEALNWVDTTV